MRQRNVFALGLNEFNLRKLQGIRRAAECSFHGVLDPDEVLEAEHFPIADMLRRAEEQIAAVPGPVDAIIGYVDFPVSTMVPILAARFGVPSASLQSLLKCEHKYWSRLLQREVVPQHVPAFETFDPFDADPLAGLTLDFPFWVKPIKSAGSFLGFRVGNAAEFEEALGRIRAGIGVFAEPFNHILRHAEIPPEVAGVDGRHCIAEAIIGGRQCTLEGYVFEGAVHFHGVVDSIRARNRSTFLRYQYPSRLPARVIRTMERVTRRFLRHIGYDNAAFNIEFFWDAADERIWLLEVNTRIAQHHSELFEKVDGVSNHEVVVDVALGLEPRFPSRQGRFRYAACCFLRAYDDGEVTAVPSPETIAALEREVPGLIVELHVAPGMRLSELTHQESYSYVLALLYLGGDDPQSLQESYRHCKRRLRFDIRPAEISA